jgi:hypothetical protein
MSAQHPMAPGITPGTDASASSAAASRPAQPSPRVAAELDPHWRALACIVGILSLAYGAVLAWREDADGIAVAAAFAVGLANLIFALAGVVPSSVKVGDVEFQLQRAKAEGKEEGAQLGKAQGKAEGVQEGAVAGLRTAAALCEKVKEGEMQPAEVEAVLAEALSSDKPLDLPLVEGPPLPVANLGDEAPAAANRLAQAFSSHTGTLVASAADLADARGLS